MEKTEIAIHDLDDNRRITARYDTERYALEDIIGDDRTGVVSLLQDRNIMPIRLDYCATGLDADILRLADNFHYHSHPNNYVELRERAITLYLNLKGYECLFYDLRGYSQSEWAYVVIFQPINSDSKLIDIAKTLNQWFSGDIYSVHAQVLETYTNDNDPSDKIYEWITRDSAYCVMPSDSIEKDLPYWQGNLSFD